MEIAELSGFKIYDEIEYKRVFNYQFLHGQIEFLEYEEKTIGLLGWLTVLDGKDINVCINNLFVLEQYRDKFNIFDMCKFFKEKYPNINKLEWHNQKKDKFRQLILKGRKI